MCFRLLNLEVHRSYILHLQMSGCDHNSNALWSDCLTKASVQYEKFSVLYDCCLSDCMICLHALKLLQTVQHQWPFYIRLYDIQLVTLVSTSLTGHHQSSHILTSSLTYKTEMEVHKLKQAGVLMLTVFVREKTKTNWVEYEMAIWWKLI